MRLGTLRHALKQVAICFTAVLIGGVAAPVSAGPGELGVWGSPALREVMTELIAKFAREAGQSVALQFGSPAQLKQRVSQGDHPDLVIFPDEVMQSLDLASLGAA